MELRTWLRLFLIYFFCVDDDVDDLGVAFRSRLTTAILGLAVLARLVAFVVDKADFFALALERIFSGLVLAFLFVRVADLDGAAFYFFLSKFFKSSAMSCESFILDKFTLILTGAAASFFVAAAALFTNGSSVVSRVLFRRGTF